MSSNSAKELNGVGVPPRSKISAFVVCFNEEDQIEACLDSLSFCDEIVVIDSFSTDRTVEFCRARGARVLQRAWPGYREQKAFGLEQTVSPWVINLDADERVSEPLRKQIISILEEDYRQREGNAGSGIELDDGYEINRVVYFLGRWWRKGGWYPEYRVRFFRRDRVTWGGIDPHEKAVVHGRVGRLEGELEHFTYKNIDEQLERLHSYASISAREEFKRGGRASIVRLLLNPVLRTIKFYFLKRGFKEGTAGLVVAIVEGYYTFMKYAKLWELQTQAATGSTEGDNAQKTELPGA